MQYQERNKEFSWMLENFIAHRGYHNPTCPENTMGAFELAIKEGFHIELDLHLSKDGYLIVFHDDDMERLTGHKGRIEDLTLEEIKEFKVLGSTYGIPVFEDVLKLINGQVGIVIELKTSSDMNEKLVKKTLEVLKDYKGKYVVQSFDPTIMIKVRKANPNIIRGQLVTHYKDTDFSKLKKWLLANMKLNFLVKPDFINSYEYYYTKKMKRFQKHRKVVCWTVRSKEEQVEALKKFDNIIFEKYDPRG